eukprot:633329-Prorocentrum_minimum.AAC.5
MARPRDQTRVTKGWDQSDCDVVTRAGVAAGPAAAERGSHARHRRARGGVGRVLRSAGTAAAAAGGAAGAGRRRHAAAAAVRAARVRARRTCPSHTHTHTHKHSWVAHTNNPTVVVLRWLSVSPLCAARTPRPILRGLACAHTLPKSRAARRHAEESNGADLRRGLRIVALQVRAAGGGRGLRRECVRAGGAEARGPCAGHRRADGLRLLGAPPAGKRRSTGGVFRGCRRSMEGVWRARRVLRGSRGRVDGVWRGSGESGGS